MLKKFSNEPIGIIGSLNFRVESNGWQVDSWKLLMVAKGRKSLIRKNLVSKIGPYKPETK